MTLAHLTAEGHTWTRDFCRWWFHIKLPEHCEIDGDHYILPSYWAGTNIGPCKLTLRRIYLELWHWEKKKVLDIGFLMFDAPDLMFKPKIEVAQQVKWMELDKYINENKASLANIGLYGIEGAIDNYILPPLSELIEHVLKGVKVTDDPNDEIVNLEWERYDKHMLDARTGFEWQALALSHVLAEHGLKWINGTDCMAQVEALNEAGKAWLVKHYDEEKEHIETES